MRIESDPSNAVFVMQPTGVVPSQCFLTRDGRRLFNLLGLESMTGFDYAELARHF